MRGLMAMIQEMVHSRIFLLLQPWKREEAGKDVLDDAASAPGGTADL